MTTSHYSPTAVSYAKALLDLARDQSAEIGQEIEDVRQIVEGNPTFAAFLADPGISHAERGGVLERVFGGKVSGLMWNFLRVLNEHGRLRLIPEIAGAYHEMLDERLG